MVELVGAHGLDEAKFVHVLFEIGQAIGNPLAAAPALMKWILGTKKLWNAGDESKSFAD